MAILLGSFLHFGNLKITISTTFHKAEVAAGSHAIRQAWRFNTLQQWANGERHEAKQWSNTIPTEPVKDMLQLDQDWIRQMLMHGSAENRAVLLGSTVSPAWLAVSSPQTNNGACPWCNMHGHWMHLAWECPQIPEAHRRPHRPPTFLASRFGWPTKNTPEDRRKEVLQWLSHVQGLIWQERYN